MIYQTINDRIIPHAKKLLKRSAIRSNNHSMPRSLEHFEVHRLQEPRFKFDFSQVPLNKERVVQCADNQLVTGHLKEGQEKHHPMYFFNLPGKKEPEPYDLDLWVTKKYKNSPTEAYKNKNLNPTIDEIVNNWDCSISIIHGLIDNLLAAEKVEDWKLSKIRSEVFGQEGSEIVKHFLSLKENIMRRESDIPQNCPTSVKIKSTNKLKKNKPTEENQNLGWNIILRETRELLKVHLINHEKPPEDKNTITLVDEAIKLTSETGFKKLRDNGHFNEKLEFSTTGYSNNNLDTHDVSWMNKKLKFNFAINHLRFIIYMEWRAVYELLNM
jgi:hypothetical protein